MASKGGVSIPYSYEKHGHDPNHRKQSSPKETAIKLEKYLNTRVLVKFGGGRQGILKGFDPLFNLVLDNTIETVKRADEPDTFRDIGLLVCRGTCVLIVSPADGSEEIDNPFPTETD